MNLHILIYTQTGRLATGRESREIVIVVFGKCARQPFKISGRGSSVQRGHTGEYLSHLYYYQGIKLYSDVTVYVFKGRYSF